MSTVDKATDTILVSRDGTDYRTTVETMSTLADTDLLLVNRGGVDYQCTAADVKAAIGGGGPGSNWTAPGGVTGLPATGLYGPKLGYNNGVWLLYQGNSVTYYTSTDDGATWTAGTFPFVATNGISIATGNGLFAVAVRSGTNGVTAYKSSDGVNWQYASMAYQASSSQYGIQNAVITYGRNAWYIGAANTMSGLGAMDITIVQSADLLTWSSSGRVSGDGPDIGFTLFAALAVNSSSVNTSGAMYNRITYDYKTVNSGYGSSASQVQVLEGVWRKSPPPQNYCIAGQNNIIAFLNDSDTTCKARAFTDINGTRSAVFPSVGFNHILCGFYNPVAGAICAAGAGGAITMSYDDGLNWAPSYKQYDIAGVSEVTFTGAACSPNMGMLLTTKADGSVLLLRSTF